MKVLLYHLTPFALAHGGVQTQIVQTRAVLEQLGVEVEFLRWWDPTQTGDILHFVGRLRASAVQLARGTGMKVILAELLAEQAARPRLRLKLQKLARLGIDRTPLRRLPLRSWDGYAAADACLALTDWEAFLMKELYGAPANRIHVVPNGVEEVFLKSPPAAQRGPWLVCTATIRELKRIVELAEAAVQAQTPLWIIGRPYSEAAAYAQRFYALAKAHPRILRYEGPIADRARLAQVYREARGFVLLSAMESLSLSALEAAACECPLLLSRLPWATGVFGEHACYCPVTPSAARTAGFLRQFYDAAPDLKPPPRPLTWLEVGQQLKRLYESLLSTSR